MLRITHEESAMEQRWTLCGELAGPWASELMLAWLRTRYRAAAKVIDLRQVTFIDETGEQVLRVLKREGVSFVADGVDTKHLVANLASTGRCPLRRCLALLGKQ
jgi:hypothetical protein